MALSLSRWFLDRAAALAVLAALGVCVLGLLPEAGPSWETQAYAHAGAFLVIAFLFAAALPRLPWVGLLGALAFGGVIEAGQALVPGRWASMEDMAANLVGVVLGGLLYWISIQILRLLERAEA